MRVSPFGPLRKYYYITKLGKLELSEFINSWKEIKMNIDNVLGGDLDIILDKIKKNKN